MRVGVVDDDGQPVRLAVWVELPSLIGAPDGNAVLLFPYGADGRTPPTMNGVERALVLAVLRDTIARVEATP